MSKPKYPYDQLQNVGDVAGFTSDKTLASIYEAFRQHGKRHGVKYRIEPCPVPTEHGEPEPWYNATRTA